MWFLFFSFPQTVNQRRVEMNCEGGGGISDIQYCKYKIVAIRTGGIYTVMFAL